MALPLLSLLIWVPIIAGFTLLFFRKKQKESLVRAFALFIAISCFGLSLNLLLGFDAQCHNMQWNERHDWIPSLNVFYELGIDGFSLAFILLTCFMTILVILASYRSVKEKVSQYLAAFLIMQGLMCGVFSAMDSILFYSFWEAMLIPMFLIIGIWGGRNRHYATIKFFLYTFLGSVLLLIAIIYLQIVAKNSFSILAFYKLPLTLVQQKWIFLAMLVAFAVKIPMWPIHTWLPDAHVEAPTGGSVILAAILLKMGGYGFLRFLLPIVPDACDVFSTGMIILSLVAIIYIAWVALVQEDMKKLIAYSSISHMGIVTLGFFVVFPLVKKTADFDAAVLSIEGAFIQMISHGFISAGLFFSVGMLYDRLHSRLIRDYGGIANSMPIFAAFFMLLAMANIGLPGTSGFVGEFLVIFSAFKANIGYAFFAATLLVFGASYTLWMYKRVVFGAVVNQAVSQCLDIDAFERLNLVLLILAILVLGIWPEPLLNLIQGSAEHLVQQLLHSKLGN